MMLSVAPLQLSNPIPAPERLVLLVDDHLPSLAKLQAVVESAGYPCSTAASASEALVYCDSRRPTLVVTDLSMPCLDGRGLARYLKARYPAMPILLLTGEQIDPTTHHNLSRTFAAVLAKPLEVEPFLTLLDDLIPLPDSRSCR